MVAFYWIFLLKMNKKYQSILLIVALIVFSSLAYACPPDFPNQESGVCRNLEGYDENGLDRDGFDRNSFNPEKGIVKKDGVVPLGYNGIIKPLGAFIIAGPGTYNIEGGTSLTVSESNVKITKQPDGSLLIADNVISGDIIKYSAGSYDIMGEGSVNGVPISNGHSIVVDIETGIIIGFADKGCSVSGIGYSEGTLFDWNPSEKVMIFSGGTIVDIADTFTGTINTNFKEITLPNGVKIDGKLSFEKGSKPHVKAGNQVFYNGYRSYMIDQSFSTNDVYIFTEVPDEYFDANIVSEEDEPHSFTADSEINYVVLNNKEVIINSLSDSTICIEVMPGNELFNTFKTDYDDKSISRTSPDKKDYLRIIVKNGDRIVVVDREEDRRIPLVQHMSSSNGKTIINNGEFTFELDRNGFHLPVDKLNSFYDKLAKLQKQEKYYDLVASLKESVALEIESDSDTMTDKIFRIGSGNAFAFYEKGRESPRLTFDSAGMPISDRIDDNSVQTVGQLQYRFANIQFDDQGCSPFLVQAVYYWLKKDYLGVSSVYDRFILNPAHSSFAFHRLSNGETSFGVSIGEMTIRRAYFKHEALFSNVFQVFGHETTHVLDYWTEYGEESKGAMMQKRLERIGGHLKELQENPACDPDSYEYKQLNEDYEKQKKAIDNFNEQESLFSIVQKIVKRAEDELEKNPEKINSVLRLGRKYLERLSPEDREELNNNAKKFLMFVTIQDEDNNLVNPYLPYKDVRKITGKQLVDDWIESIDAVLIGEKDSVLDSFCVENFFSSFAYGSKNKNIENLVSFRKSILKAVEETSGLTSQYALIEGEHIATIIDREDSDLIQRINSPNKIVRDTVRDTIIVLHDASMIPEQRFVKLMNSQTPGCTPGNCFCDINPDQCEKCLIYKKTCVET